MIKINGETYFTKEEMKRTYDNFIYLLNFKGSMVECYKNQVVVLEELLDKLLLEIKEKHNEEIKDN